MFSEQELYLTLVIMFACVFFDVDPVKSFELALGARTVAQKLGKLVEANVRFTSTTGMFSHLVDKMRETEGPMNDYGVKMIRR